MSFGLIFRRDHIQKWTRVVQTALKQWNCEAKLQKIGHLPRRPQNMLCFVLMFFLYVFPIFFYVFLCYFTFSSFSQFWKVIESVIEGTSSWLSTRCFSIIFKYVVMFNYFCIFFDSFHYFSSIVSIFAYLLQFGIIYLNLLVIIMI